MIFFIHFRVEYNRIHLVKNLTFDVELLYARKRAFWKRRENVKKVNY